MSEAQDSYLHRNSGGRLTDAVQSSRPPKDSRIESALSRRMNQIKILAELAARAEHLAVKWCGPIPEDPSAGPGNIPNAGSVIGAMETQNEESQLLIARLNNALDRLQNL